MFRLNSFWTWTSAQPAPEPVAPIGGGWWDGPKPEDPYRKEKEALKARDVQMHRNTRIAMLLAAYLLDE